ncbi:hypothetical protein OC834_005209 [Tilletia horrida]|nr:hypothetical protein OC834_005209 [Tilletia horrida]
MSETRYFSPYFLDANGTIPMCPKGPGNANVTFVDPSAVTSTTRRCGFHGANNTAVLTKCCTPGAPIEVSGHPGPCGFLCAYNGTLTDWATCLGDSSLEPFCLSSQLSDAAAGAAVRRRGDKHVTTTSLRWSTLLVTVLMFACLLPSVAAFPSRSSLSALLPMRRASTLQCDQVANMSDPYLARTSSVRGDDDSNSNFYINTTSSTSQPFVSPSHTLKNAIYSTFSERAGTAEHICSLIYPAPDTTCTLGLNKALTTSYEAFSPNGTKTMVFFLDRGYWCVDANLTSCSDSGATYRGTFCASHLQNSSTPLAWWSSIGEKDRYLPFQSSP